jgi:hypothetical protein
MKDLTKLSTRELLSLIKIELSKIPYFNELLAEFNSRDLRSDEFDENGNYKGN